MRSKPISRRARRLPPKPPEPPPGYMWFYWELVRIDQVHRMAQTSMGGFDRLPRSHRNKINYER
jgi:hypothetical protein